MKKLLLTLVVSFALCGSIFAQQYESHYPFNYHDFMYQSPFVAGITIDGQIITHDYEGWDALEVAPFVIIDGEEQFRGHNYWLIDDYVLEYGDPFPILDGYPLYYTEAGDEVFFKMWDHANGVEYTEYTVTYLGEPLTIYTGVFYDQGWDDPENPVWLNFVSPAQEGYTLEIDPYTGENDNYYLIASPVGGIAASEVEGLMTPSYDFFSFDQTEELEWVNLRDNAEFELQPGMGYLYANNTGTDLTFIGNPVAEDSYTIALTKVEGAQWAGWNLVGNPFAEDAYIADGRAFYTMNESGSELIESSGVIPAMNGFFVVAEEDDEVLNLTTTEPAKVALVALNLSDTRGLIDRAVVRFGEGRILPKFQLNRNSTKVYIPLDNQDYAVVASEGMGEMPVNFKAENNGTYTLAVSAEEVSFNYLHLIDNLTGADVDLLVNPTYSFDAQTTDYASRFRLVFATGNAEDNFAFFSNGNFIVSNEGEATVQVIDVNGRILSSQNINGSASINVDGAAGVYMIRLVNGDNTKVQKVVVR